MPSTERTSFSTAEALRVCSVRGNLKQKPGCRKHPIHETHNLCSMPPSSFEGVSMKTSRRKSAQLLAVDWGGA
jgi:hypothetical protein